MVDSATQLPTDTPEAADERAKAEDSARVTKKRAREEKEHKARTAARAKDARVKDDRELCARECGHVLDYLRQRKLLTPENLTVAYAELSAGHHHG